MPSPVLSREAAYAALAANQYGLITTDQLRALGISRAGISRRVQSGALIPVLPRVYRLPAVSRSWHQRVMAVQLWAGLSSVIGGPAAAALHRLDGFPMCRGIDVVTPRVLRPPDPGIMVRRPRGFPAQDRTEVDRIPVMTCVRTLIDVAGTASEAQLELALEDARRRNLITPKMLERRLAAMPANQAGRRRLHNVLSRLVGTRPSESGLEVKILRMLRQEGYPEPIRQEVLDDRGEFAGRVDLVYPGRRLIIEVQSHRWHSDRRAGDNDSERTNRHQAMGWIVIEARHHMLRGEARTRFLADLARVHHRQL